MAFNHQLERLLPDDALPSAMQDTLSAFLLGTGADLGFSPSRLKVQYSTRYGCVRLLGRITIGIERRAERFDQLENASHYFAWFLSKSNLAAQRWLLWATVEAAVAAVVWKYYGPEVLLQFFAVKATDETRPINQLDWEYRGQVARYILVAMAHGGLLNESDSLVKESDLAFVHNPMILATYSEWVSDFALKRFPLYMEACGIHRAT